MKWFKHEGYARADEKIEKLLIKYGADGYALYFYCVEIIAGNLSSENITFELKHDSETIANRLKLDTLRVEEIMKWMIKEGLFQVNDTTGRVMCLGLLRRLDNTLSQNQEIRKLLSSEEFQSFKALAYHGKNVQLQDNLIDLKQKRREEKKKEEKRQNGAWFISFWKEYPRKVSKQKAEQSFNKVCTSEKVFQEIMRGLRCHKGSEQWLKDGGQYVPYPSTFLNQRRWEDEDVKPALAPIRHCSNPLCRHNLKNELKNHASSCYSCGTDISWVYEKGEADAESNSL